MITNRACQRFAVALLFICFCSWLTGQASAQFFPFGGGTTQGRTTGSRSGTSGTSGTRDYPNNTEIGEAMISSDAESRRLVIVTDEDTNLRISQIISNLDRPKPQVLIKVVFLELTYNNSKDVGVEGGLGRRIGNSTTSAVANVFGLSGLNTSPTGGVLNAVGQNVTSFVPTPPGAGLYQIFGQDYQVTMRAIAQAGNAEVLSRPSILTRNSQPATITVGQSVPLTTSVRFDTFGNAINSVTYTDVGIILKVTPFITSEGMVEMIVAPELSSVAATGVTISTGITAPIIDKRTADTVVVTPDGQTVIIGGLMGRTKTKTENKIPILGDIPLLGMAFKRKATTDVKTELLIFLTPHVVPAPTQLSALSTSEREKANIKPSAITEQELNQFLDGLPMKQADEKEKRSPARSKDH